MLVFRKDILNEVIEKALRGSQRDNHKYIFRREVAEKTSGKSIRRYEYIYENDRQLRPIEMLKKFFGIGQKEIDADYEKGNIQKDFNADKKTFAQHLVEYFSHRSIWDRRFAKKDNQQKFKKPVKMQIFKETVAVIDKEMETPEAESTIPELFSAKETKPQGEKAWKANPYLMRKIWGMYTGKTVEQNEKQEKTAKEILASNRKFLEEYYKNSVGGMTIQDVKDGKAHIIDLRGKGENRSEAMKGNQNAKGHSGDKGSAFKFSSLTDREKAEMGKRIQSSVVSSVESGIIKKTDEKSASKVAQEWVEKNFIEPANSFIGEVAIKKGNIKDSLAHGFGQDKLDAIPAIKDVLEKGTYLGYEYDSDGATIKNHYFAAKVNFPSGDKIVFCRVHEAEGDDTNRFYVHEVFTEDEIKKESSFQTSTADKGKKTGRPLYSFILRDILNVKEKPKDTKEEREKLIAKFAEKYNLAPNVVENGFKQIDSILKKTEKKPTKAQLLRDTIKPQLREMGIIPNMQIEATNTEQIDNLKALLETIATMPKIGKGNYEAKLHYFVSGLDYYITELDDNGEAYGYCDNNGDPQMSEWGYIDLKELAKIGDLKGLNIDYHFKPKLVGDLIKENGHNELYEHYSDVFGEEEAKQKKHAEKESEAEARENRSNAMLGNQNARKFGMPEDVYETMRNMVSEQVNGHGLKNRQILFEKLYKKDEYFREKLDLYGGTGNKETTGYNRSDIFNALYDDVTGDKNGEDNSGTGRDGISADTGNIRNGTGETDSGADVLEAEPTDNGDGFVQQPRESGIGLGEPTTDERGNGAGSGRVTKATAKQIRAKCLEILASKKDSEMTAEDKALLAQYEGGGGLNEGGQSTKAVLTEFYTPRDVISKVWQLVDKYNPNQKKKVLEPSSGIGRFTEGRSENFTLCELDETSARIAGILHPESEVKQGAFQKLFMSNNAVTGYKDELYDVAIGNPPYGAYNDLYKGLGEGKYHTRYEEYFIDRSLDTLKDGGILAFVVPSSFLRGKDGKGKEAIAKKGKLLEAWRLPKGTFSSTDVGTDIIIIQKGKGDIADYCDNKYFSANESHVIGHESDGKDRFGKPTKVVNLPEGKTVSEAIAMIDTNAVEVTAKGTTTKAEKIVENIEVKDVEADLSKRFTAIGKIEIGAKLIRPDGAEGKITYITDSGMIGYEFDGKTNPIGRTSIEDFAVAADNETAEEEHRNRSEAMKGNENAKKAVHKKTIKKAVKGDVFTPSIGENMTSSQFNAKYSKNIPEADMKFWRVTDWEGKVDVTKLSDAERKELESNKNFVTDENGNFVNVANYASGNIYEKLANLEREKDRINKESYEKKKAILEAVLPVRKNVMQFTVSPIENFSRQFKNDDGISLKEQFLEYCGFNEWGNIPYGANCPIPKSELADGMTFKDIWEYINQIPVRTERARNEEDKETAKMFAEQKKNARRETTERLFNKWLRELPERQQKAIEDEWNFRFNSRVNPDYTKIPLFVDGMNTHKGKKKFDMTEQQIKGVSMLCNKGNGILAYDVGVGKTVTGIVATVNQIQTGKSDRPLICVPKAVYKKWIKEIKQHFPNIDINELGNFSEKDLGKFKDENGNAVLPKGTLNICTYEALQKVTFTEETLNGDLRDDMLDSQSVYDYDEYGNLVEDTRSEREKAQAEEKLMKMLGVAAKAKEGAFYWEDLGIDHITVDELHNFKNVFSIPRTFGKSVRSTNEKKTDYWGRKVKADDDPGQLANEYSGMQGASSSRAMKLFAISQLIQRDTNGRGFFGLSATPFNNSPVEIYNILSMVARNRLKDLQIYNLQDFMRQFAELKPDWKVKANGDVESAQVMKNFKNLNALQNLITEFIDKVDGEEAGVIRPYKRVHKPELELTPLQKAIIKAETDRMDGKFAKPEDKDKQSAETLIAMNNMRMATLSPSLIDPKFWADYEGYEGWHAPKMSDIVKESPKLQFVCDTVSKMYKDRPTEGQVIYMPRGVEQYQSVKEYLVKQGIPADAIAFMNSDTSLDAKEKIKDDFNDVDGKIKVIIGSETIKEGVSLNGNSSTIYNCMLGWNPTETIQVEGRIWRQGNKQGITHVVYPLMNDSIDAMMYQKYDEKSSRLNALWSYKGDSLNVEDINPEELKFDLIKDPTKRANMKILQEQAQLKKDKKMQDALYDTIVQQKIDRENLSHNVKLYAQRLPEHEERIKKLTNTLEEMNGELKAAKKVKDENEIKSLERNIENLKYSLNMAKSEQRQTNKAKKETEERIGAIENSWKKQGVDNPKKIDEKLSEISAKRQNTQKEIDEIANKREFYIEQAKKQIEEQQKAIKHYSVADRVEYYASEIGKDLKPFDEIKDQIQADMEKKRGTVVKAFIYKGRLLIKTS